MGGRKKPGKHTGLDEVKTFLRVDFDEDDGYISLLIHAAQDYISDAVGWYDGDSARHRLLMLALVSTLYQNRRYTVDTSDEKVMYPIRSMVLQLQLGGSADE